MTTTREMSIAVVGGCIGGLTLALAPYAKEARAEVYEQAAALTEICAAVALSVNATCELGRLGCLTALDAVSTEPTELIWRDGHDGLHLGHRLCAISEEGVKMRLAFDNGAEVLADLVVGGRGGRVFACPV